MNNSISDLTPQQLRSAAELKEKISALQSELDKIFSGKPAPSAGAKVKGKISPEGLARIVAAQKRRWAIKKKAAKKTAAAAAKK